MSENLQLFSPKKDYLDKILIYPSLYCWDHTWSPGSSAGMPQYKRNRNILEWVQGRPQKYKGWRTCRIRAWEPGAEKAQGRLTHVYTWWESQTLDSGGLQQDKRQWAQTEKQFVVKDKKTLFFFWEYDWLQEAVAWKSGEVPLLGDTQSWLDMDLNNLL